MFKILVKRIDEYKNPFDIVFESNQDWTHFTHLHRKTHVRYRLLYKNGNRQIFLYKGRRLYPLPFYDDYIVFREDRPSQHGFRNVYIHAKSGHVHTLDVTLKSQGKGTLIVADNLFSLPSYWRFLPKFFLRIFLWVYTSRMDRVMEEDLDLINDRVKQGRMPTIDDSCAPTIPEVYDILDDFFKKDASEMADAHFQYHVVEGLNGNGRRLQKNLERIK